VKTLQDILINTWASAHSHADSGRYLSFPSTHNYIKEWKRELRKHDITHEVVNALEGVPQGLKFHPEFDAFDHIYYVVSAVLRLKRTDLIEAAFLHDYGKGTKTNIGNDRVYGFGHPIESLKFIERHKNRIKYYDLTYRMTKQHMDLPIGHKKLKDDVDLDDFVTADKIISKRLYLKESTWIDRFKNRIKEKIVYFRQRHSKKKVYIMVGIAGSGKSRYLKKVDPKYIVSPDEIRRELTGDITNQSMNYEVWPTAKARMKVVLKRYGKVYLDATNVNKWLRVEFMSDFNGAQKIAIVFESDVEISLERINKDVENGVDRSVVPEEVIRKQYKLFNKGEESLKHEFNKVVYY
jgi:predicted kinase